MQSLSNHENIECNECCELLLCVYEFSICRFSYKAKDILMQKEIVLDETVL